MYCSKQVSISKHVHTHARTYAHTCTHAHAHAHTHTQNSKTLSPPTPSHRNKLGLTEAWADVSRRELLHSSVIAFRTRVLPPHANNSRRTNNPGVERLECKAHQRFVRVSLNLVRKPLPVPQQRNGLGWQRLRLPKEFFEQKRQDVVHEAIGAHGGSEGRAGALRCVCECNGDTAPQQQVPVLPLPPLALRSRGRELSPTHTSSRCQKKKKKPWRESMRVCVCVCVCVWKTCAPSFFLSLSLFPAPPPKHLEFTHTRVLQPKASNLECCLAAAIVQEDSDV